MEYVPGERNIDAGGRRGREIGAVLGFTAFMAFLALRAEALISLGGAALGFFLLYFGFYNFIQEEQGFCGTFGALGFHYGEGGLQRTSDEEARSTDISKSLRQNIAALSLTALFTGWTVLLVFLAS